MIEFGPFSLDRATGKLRKHGTPLRLAGMPLKILVHLSERPGETVSRGELQKLLWSGAAFGDFEQGLSSAVNVLRKTLSDSADQPRYIETITGQGYRFIAPIRSAATVEAAPAPPNATKVRFSWAIAATLVLAAAAGGVWWKFRSIPQALLDGSRPSANREANDQYNLAVNFLTFQNDIPLARKTFERALELDPNFVSAHLQRANMMILEIYNGYANDEGILYQAEEALHRAEETLPGSDGLLLAVQTAVYLAQGRFDRVPMAGLEKWWSAGGNDGKGPPVLLVILRMLQGQTREPLEIVRTRLERHPLENPTRMLLGELLRMEGDSTGAISTLERVRQQTPRHITPAWFLTMAYLDNGKPEQARAMLEGMRAEFANNYMWRHAWAILLASEGRREEAFQAMDEGTLKFARLTWTVTSATADFYALQGDQTKAIEWLQLAVSRGDERVSYFELNPRLEGVQKDARFQTVLKSVAARRK